MGNFAKKFMNEKFANNVLNLWFLWFLVEPKSKPKNQTRTQTRPEKETSDNGCKRNQLNLWHINSRIRGQKTGSPGREFIIFIIFLEIVRNSGIWNTG